MTANATTVTRHPCDKCGAPSDAARAAVEWLRAGGERNPAVNLMVDHLDSPRVTAASAAASLTARVTDCEARLVAARGHAEATASRSEQEAADAARPDLPTIVREQVAASAEAVATEASKAHAAAVAVAAELVDLRSEAAAKSAEAERVITDTFDVTDVEHAFAELGLVVDGGQIASVPDPTPGQLAARWRLSYSPII